MAACVSPMALVQKPGVGSLAVPKVARIAAKLQAVLPDEPALPYRALIVQFARWPDWVENLTTQLRQTADPVERHALIEKVSRVIRCLGYGLAEVIRAMTNTGHRTTFITSGSYPYGLLRLIFTKCQSRVGSGVRATNMIFE